MLHDNERIIDFVRNTLGCTCPAEVFEKIETEEGRGATALYDQKITIGGTLLIYIKRIDRLEALNTQLPLLLAAGKEERDRKGMNRFRAVLTTEDIPAASAAANRIFNDFAGLDDTVHLHVVGVLAPAVGEVRKRLDPKKFDLPAGTVLEQIDAETIALIIDRKSRIIMADGEKIVSKAEKIKAALPSTTIALKTSAPVCSKTIKYLEGKGIRVIGS